MQLNQQSEKFLERRRVLLKAWRYAGPLLLFLIGGFSAYLLLSTPLLINPFAVASGIESGSVQQSTLQMMALFVPILFIVVCFLLIVLIILMYAALANEKKYLEILDQMHGGLG
ncbi:MAG: hypothetical protein JSU75_08405 [Gammaproteobacteria bacterium]|nr:MAG: hypothetical protein JSU75_08405 [Gammaproteobacteria bacterium]